MDTVNIGRFTIASISMTQMTADMTRFSWPRFRFIILANDLITELASPSDYEHDGCHYMNRNYLPFRNTWVHNHFQWGSCSSIFRCFCSVLWPWYWMYLFDLRLLIIPFVSNIFLYILFIYISISTISLKLCDFCINALKVHVWQTTNGVLDFDAFYI